MHNDPNGTTGTFFLYEYRFVEISEPVVLMNEDAADRDVSVRPGGGGGGGTAIYGLYRYVPL